MQRVNLKAGLNVFPLLSWDDIHDIRMWKTILGIRFPWFHGRKGDPPGH